MLELNTKEVSNFLEFIFFEKSKKLIENISLKYKIEITELNDIFKKKSKVIISEYRDIEFHNNACRKLAAAFPQFISLKEKETKSGPWKGITKLGINGKWKKAYASSQISNLEEFF